MFIVSVFGKDVRSKSHPHLPSSWMECSGRKVSVQADFMASYVSAWLLCPPQLLCWCRRKLWSITCRGGLCRQAWRMNQPKRVEVPARLKVPSAKECAIQRPRWNITRPQNPFFVPPWTPSSRGEEKGGMVRPWLVSVSRQRGIMNARDIGPVFDWLGPVSNMMGTWEAILRTTDTCRAHRQCSSNKYHFRSRLGGERENEVQLIE